MSVQSVEWGYGHDQNRPDVPVPLELVCGKMGGKLSE